MYRNAFWLIKMSLLFIFIENKVLVFIDVYTKYILVYLRLISQFESITEIALKLENPLSLIL